MTRDQIADSMVYVALAIGGVTCFAAYVGACGNAFEPVDHGQIIPDEIETKTGELRRWSDPAHPEVLCYEYVSYRESLSCVVVRNPIRPEPVREVQRWNDPDDDPTGAHD